MISIATCRCRRPVPGSTTRKVVNGFKLPDRSPPTKNEIAWIECPRRPRPPSHSPPDQAGPGNPRSTPMANGQQRSNKEVRKPKHVGVRDLWWSGSAGTWLASASIGHSNHRRLELLVVTAGPSRSSR